jgi:hypothetical protein
MVPRLHRMRSRSVGSIRLNATTSDLTTPSQKARDLRKQLEEALQSSAAIRKTQSNLGKELTTFQWKIQERRANVQSSPGRSRFSTKSAPSSPQIVPQQTRDRSFYHRNCASPSVNSVENRSISGVTARTSQDRSPSKKEYEKSPIARIRDHSARRHLRDFRSSKGQLLLNNNDKEEKKDEKIAMDTLPHDVSIVDLVSKSTDNDVEIPKSIQVNEQQYPNIVDLVSMSHSYEEDNGTNESDIVMNYSDDDGKTTSTIQQQQIDSIISGLYQAESFISHSSGGGGTTPTSLRHHQRRMNAKK